MIRSEMRRIGPNALEYSPQADGTAPCLGVVGYFVVVVIAIPHHFRRLGVVGPEPGLVHGLISAVALLIIACPCALGLVTPMSIMGDTDKLREAGASVNYLGVDSVLAGVLTVADPIKEATRTAIQLLRGEGVRIAMTTGDGEITARAVVKELGIEDVYGGVTPAAKLDIISRLQQEGLIVALAGDGVNDAAALAKTDVGIAMGTGTYVVMNSGQVTLVKGVLRGIGECFLRHCLRSNFQSVAIISLY